MIDENRIEWGYDYFGRPMLTCSVGGVTVGVKGEYGLCDVAVEAMRRKYYVVLEKGEVPVAWTMFNDPCVALSLFHKFIAKREMKRAQQGG